MGLFWIWDCLIRKSIAHLGNVADLGTWTGLYTGQLELIVYFFVFVFAFKREKFYRIYRSEPSIGPLIFELKQNEN